MKLKYHIFWSLFLGILLFTPTKSWTQIPEAYYQSAVGKSKASLKTALYEIIKNHTVLEYYSSSTSFQLTDWHPATETQPTGYFWDMYSSYQRNYWAGMNREHNLPKSWWSDAPQLTVAYSDLHNLYPSDADANSAKSNYSLGEVSDTPAYYNGVIKVGTNSFPGYNGTVFEPADEYKGDFARDYMYMVTCYENYANNWRSTGTASMLSIGTYPVFKPWAVNLLLKWHRNDPVSQKEINRNNAVYRLQNNRNPFVDHAELAEYIWGKYMTSSWLNDGSAPQSELDFSLQPNPAKTDITVIINKPEQSTFCIKSINGISLKAGSFSASGKIAVDELKNGMYIMEVYNINKKMVAPFIVKH